MKLRSVLLSGLMLVCASTVVLADTKIGSLNMETLMTSSKQAKGIKERMTKEFEGRNKDITSKRENYQKQVEAFQKDAAVMSAQEKTKKERAITQLGGDIQRLEQEFRVDTATREREEMIAFMKAVKEASEVVAKKEKVTAILPEHSMIYWDKSVDLTDKVMTELNTKK